MTSFAALLILSSEMILVAGGLRLVPLGLRPMALCLRVWLLDVIRATREQFICSFVLFVHWLFVILFVCCLFVLFVCVYVCGKELEQ